MRFDDSDLSDSVHELDQTLVGNRTHELVIRRSKQIRVSYEGVSCGLGWSQWTNLNCREAQNLEHSCAAAAANHTIRTAGHSVNNRVPHQLSENAAPLNDKKGPQPTMTVDGRPICLVEFGRGERI